MPPAPLQPKRVLVLADLPAVKVKKKGAPRLKGLAIIDQVLGNNGVTIVRNQGGPAVARHDGGNDGAAVAGTIVAKPPAVIHTPAALSAPRQEAAPTATAAAAIQTAIVITAQRVADGGTRNVHRILSMSEGGAEDADDRGENTPLPPQKTPAHVHAATAEGRGTGGTIGAAQEAPAAGAAAAAPVQDPGGAVTVEATALSAARPAPPKDLLTGEARGVEGTVRHTAGTLTALAFTAPSHHAHLLHEALTATPIHRAHRL